MHSLSTAPHSVDTPHPQRPPIYACVIAGAFGGAIGDTTMHSLDTVKTRQQGFSYNPQYRRMVPAYLAIFRNEGIRGLYGGYLPAILGLVPSTGAFFGTYEVTKRRMLAHGVNENVAYFLAGIFGDLASSVFYVPSEVFKTRFQLQGRHNNPYTRGCGYNYRNLRDAFRILAKEPKTLFYGYKETMMRDLPFSALQFAFYERFRQVALAYFGPDLLIPLELGTGAAAGGLAGVLTTPLDVIKTRIQTATIETAGSHEPYFTASKGPLGRFIHRLSTLSALHSIYKNEGTLGMFLGVGPRFIWTGVQSLIMLLLYQLTLKQLTAEAPSI